jgi:hypothetical protein
MAQGVRRRYVRREDAAAWCPTGRWGPRRIRVTECAFVLRAETVYTVLLCDPHRLCPGARGSATVSVRGFMLTADWQIRANAVWRFGRVFLRCARCERLATRLYMPTASSWLACRRCWGLTYESRQRANYKDVGRFSALGLTCRSLAKSQTISERERRSAAAAERFAERARLRQADCPEQH